ncbi:hypothetical protein CRG98_036660 [Punica granatum]|uniref:Uncharacterized protein n=1 Tax=Punica granatum TaxID=22663 RepID=A0A2I0IFV3_PUNGR|nr:hypothetical protein CRG98_036660 [Punica granatum]
MVVALRDSVPAANLRFCHRKMVVGVLGEKKPKAMISRVGPNEGTSRPMDQLYQVGPLSDGRFLPTHGLGAHTSGPGLHCRVGSFSHRWT